MAKKALTFTAIVMILIMVIIFLNLSWLKQIYSNQAHAQIGYVMNGGIIIIFLVGIFKIIFELARYTKEEKAIEKFELNCKSNVEDRLLGIDKSSLIARRYEEVKKLSEKAIKPDVKTLSGFLYVSESSRKTFLEYVNNILILTGVFGTVVSLIISLLGASDFIKLSDEKSMGYIIFGMSTALNTTFTAIFCYFVYHYFLSKYSEVQEYVLLRIEELTYFEIIPAFSFDAEMKTEMELKNAFEGIKEVINDFNELQKSLREYASKFSKLLTLNYEMYRSIETCCKELKEIIKEGFRLK